MDIINYPVPQRDFNGEPIARANRPNQSPEMLRALRFKLHDGSDPTVREDLRTPHANIIQSYVNTSDWVTKPPFGEAPFMTFGIEANLLLNQFGKSRGRMNPMKVISGAHSTVRNGHLGEEITAALRMTENFSEDYFNKLNEEEIARD
jgi:hypothetical protein